MKKLSETFKVITGLGFISLIVALIILLWGTGTSCLGQETEDIKRWHGLGVKPAGGLDLFTCRQMSDGTWKCGMNEGASVGLAIDIEGTGNGALAFFDPQFKLSLHPGVKQANGTFNLGVSGILGFFPWGIARLLEGGIRIDLTEKPEGTKDRRTYIFGVGFSWGKGGP